MDDLDRAKDTELLYRQQGMRNKRPEGPRATGVCLYCEEPCAGRWCSIECRDSWSEEQRISRGASLTT